MSVSKREARWPLFLPFFLPFCLLLDFQGKDSWQIYKINLKITLVKITGRINQTQPNFQGARRTGFRLLFTFFSTLEYRNWGSEDETQVAS